MSRIRDPLCSHGLSPELDHSSLGTASPLGFPMQLSIIFMSDQHGNKLMMLNIRDQGQTQQLARYWPCRPFEHRWAFLKACAMKHPAGRASKVEPRHRENVPCHSPFSKTHRLSVHTKSREKVMSAVVFLIPQGSNVFTLPYSIPLSNVKYSL